MTQDIIPYQNAELEKVNDLEKRIVDFLPGGKDIPHDVRMAMAQISIAHGLDPFLREVWPIPKMQGGQVVGYDMFIGISGWRNAAHRSGEYWGRRFEKVSDEERKWLAAGPADLVVKCIVMRRKTGQHAAEFDGYGIARPDERSKMNKFQLARLRAERDAMKAAFPISSPLGVTLKAVDDEGEIINGDHGPEWETIERETLTGAPLQDQFEKNRRELGRDDSDLVTGYTPQFEPIEITLATTPALVEAGFEPLPVKTYRMASVKFDGMTPEQWHAVADKFCADNPNWQKNGKSDISHIMASAGRAGYQFITGDNYEDVFTAIVGNHAAKKE
jgi:hypothetical protein